MRWRRTLALYLLLGVAAIAIPGPSISHAEDTFLASVRLRAGFDANPTLVENPRGTGFIGLDAAFAAGHDNGAWSLGVVGEASSTRYLDQAIVPAESGKLTLAIANKAAADKIGLRATTTAATTSTYNTRTSDFVQSLRAEWDGKTIRPFITGEVRLAELNETNALFTSFLPEPHRFARVTLIPGVEFKFGPAEVGASVNLSATKYLQAVDLFGFVRDNQRVQPFLFFKYQKDGLQISANVSQLRGYWHDPDFTNVDRTLFEASASYTIDKVTLELGLQRTIADTTFPLSPVTLVTLASGKARLKVDDKLSVGASARYATIAYLDTPLTTRQLSMGLDAMREVWPDFFIGAEIARNYFQPLAGTRVSGTAVTLSAMKRFKSIPAEKRAETTSARPTGSL
jgi:hypothetical protein